MNTDGLNTVAKICVHLRLSVDKILHHDYVVRMLKGPVRVRRDDAEGEMSVKLDIPDDWRQSNMQLTGFVQNPRNGEVLQAVSLPLLDR